jgi:hypothetical protein
MPLLEFNDSQDNSDRIHHAEGWERRGVFSICVLSTANTSYNFVRQVREKNCAGRTAESSDSYKMLSSILQSHYAQAKAMQMRHIYMIWCVQT